MSHSREIDQLLNKIEELTQLLSDHQTYPVDDATRLKYESELRELYDETRVTLETALASDSDDLVAIFSSDERVCKMNASLESHRKLLRSPSMWPEDLSMACGKMLANMMGVLLEVERVTEKKSARAKEDEIGEEYEIAEEFSMAPFERLPASPLAKFRVILARTSSIPTPESCFKADDNVSMYESNFKSAPYSVPSEGVIDRTKIVMLEEEGEEFCRKTEEEHVTGFEGVIDGEGSIMLESALKTETTVIDSIPSEGVIDAQGSIMLESVEATVTDSIPSDGVISRDEATIPSEGVISREKPMLESAEAVHFPGAFDVQKCIMLESALKTEGSVIIESISFDVQESILLESALKTEASIIDYVPLEGAVNSARVSPKEEETSSAMPCEVVPCETLPEKTSPAVLPTEPVRAAKINISDASPIFFRLSPKCGESFFGIRWFFAIALSAFLLAVASNFAHHMPNVVVESPVAKVDTVDPHVDMDKMTERLVFFVRHIKQYVPEVDDLIAEIQDPNNRGKLNSAIFQTRKLSFWLRNLDPSSHSRIFYLLGHFFGEMTSHTATEGAITVSFLRLVAFINHVLILEQQPYSTVLADFSRRVASHIATKEFEEFDFLPAVIQGAVNRKSAIAEVCHFVTTSAGIHLLPIMAWKRVVGTFLFALSDGFEAGIGESRKEEEVCDVVAWKEWIEKINPHESDTQLGDYDFFLPEMILFAVVVLILAVLPMAFVWRQKQCVKDFEHYIQLSAQLRSLAIPKKHTLLEG